MTECARCKGQAEDAEGNRYRSTLWNSKLRGRFGWVCLDCLFALMTESYGPPEVGDEQAT